MSKERWIWPVTKFWNYSPLGWLLAIAWNMTEYMGIKMPYAPVVFGIIIGKGAKKV